MFLLPLFAILVQPLLQVQDQRSNYSQVVQHPDPNNGYEDYVRATDKLPSSKLDVYLNWSPADYEIRLARKKEVVDQGEAGSGWTAVDEDALRFSAELRGMDYLSVQRKMVSDCGSAIDLIRSGNQKAVWDPRESQNAATVFPEFAGFKSVAKLFRVEAYVRFADGDSKGGTDDLLQGLTFARRIGGMNIISELVSIASRSIILAAFNEQLPRLSERDAHQMVAYVDAALTEPNSYVKALQGERDLTLSGIDDMVKHPEAWGIGSSEGVPPGVPDFIAKMSPRDRNAAQDGVIHGISDFYGKAATRMNQDESGWASIKDNDELPPMPTAVNSVQGLTDILVRVFVPVIDQVTIAELKARAQLRLLGLHARIIEFRWKNNRLPADLKEAIPEKLQFDPMGGEAFHYELTDGGYKLFSKGMPSTGPIELKYRRPASLPADDKNIPPQP